jgi:endogenous inhibitor of DNA gyrase (YacG/DUF329 family)
MDQPMLRPCPRCGELEGEAVVEDRHEGIVRLPVVCICQGIPCAQCGERLVRRPISNYYDEQAGAVWHTPWLGYLSPCAICRRADR